MDDNSNIRRVKYTRNGKRKGRKRDIDAVGCLALVLFWYRTRGSSARGLSMPFGLTGTRLYVWLRFGRRVLLYSLQHVEGAKVRLPTNDEVAKFRMPKVDDAEDTGDTLGAGAGAGRFSNVGSS